MSTDAILLAADRVCGPKGRRWSDPAQRDEYSLLLAPWDSPERAVQMAAAQSSCALAICAELLIAEVDGLVRGWRGKPACDPLREPRWERYDAIMYLETLALQRGLHRTGRPELRPGIIVQIGGDGLGGPAHVLLVTGNEGQAIEGGAIDPGNPRPPPENCTAIRRTTRAIEGAGKRWTMGGRVVRWWCDAGALPTCGEGMPWERIGLKP